MLAKLGFFLLALLLGAFIFIAGALAPDTLRRPLLDLAARLNPGETLKDAAGKTASTTDSTPGKSKEQDAPAVPYETLLLPTPLPPQGSYAVQLDLYTDNANAEVWTKRAKEAGYAADVIPVVDRNGSRWIAVVVGKYTSPDDARDARDAIVRRLALTRTPAVVLLPAPAPAPRS